MTGKRRGPAQRARDRRKIADYYLKGWLQADIAKELKISQPTVSRDLKALHKEWLDSALVDFNEAVARELAEVDHLEREAWAEWQRSREQKESTVQETASGNMGKRVKAQVRKEGRLGDPQYLRIVQWCIEQRCKILGVYAADKVMVSGKIDVEDVTDWEKVAERNRREWEALRDDA